MESSFLVLVNPSATAEPAARYAAVLGAPLGVRLHLLHVCTRQEMAPRATSDAPQRTAEMLALLRQWAPPLPSSAEAEVSRQTLLEAVVEGVHRHHPLLLALGLPAQAAFYHEQLPALRVLRRPLLLVPAEARPRVPRRVVVAVGTAPVLPTGTTQRLGPLLAAWHATYYLTHVATEPGAGTTAGAPRLAQVHQSGLLPPAAPVVPYPVAATTPAAGLLQAVQETQADLLVLLTRPRRFWEGLLRTSVTDQVLRHASVPVLLLPAEDL